MQLLAEYTQDERILKRISDIEGKIDTVQDYQSPEEIIHNPQCLENLHKNLVKGPFNRIFPKILQSFLAESRIGKIDFVEALKDN